MTFQLQSSIFICIVFVSFFIILIIFCGCLSKISLLFMSSWNVPVPVLLVAKLWLWRVVDHHRKTRFIVIRGSRRHYVWSHWQQMRRLTVHVTWDNVFNKWGKGSSKLALQLVVWRCCCCANGVGSNDIVLVVAAGQSSNSNQFVPHVSSHTTTPLTIFNQA